MSILAFLSGAGQSALSEMDRMRREQREEEDRQYGMNMEIAKSVFNNQDASPETLVKMMDWMASGGGMKTKNATFSKMFQGIPKFSNKPTDLNVEPPRADLMPAASGLAGSPLEQLMGAQPATQESMVNQGPLDRLMAGMQKSLSVTQPDQYMIRHPELVAREKQLEELKIAQAQSAEASNRKLQDLVAPYGGIMGYQNYINTRYAPRPKYQRSSRRLQTSDGIPVSTFVVDPQDGSMPQEYISIPGQEPIPLTDDLAAQLGLEDYVAPKFSVNKAGTGAFIGTRGIKGVRTPDAGKPQQTPTPSNEDRRDRAEFRGFINAAVKGIKSDARWKKENDLKYKDTPIEQIEEETFKANPSYSGKAKSFMEFQGLTDPGIKITATTTPSVAPASPMISPEALKAAAVEILKANGMSTSEDKVALFISKNRQKLEDQLSRGGK